MKTSLVLVSLFLLVSAAFSQEHRFGWIGDSGQKRVRMMTPQAWPSTQIAPSSDLTKRLPPVFDQKDIGSCVGNGVATGASTASRIVTGKHLNLSRLMIYYEARRVEGLQDVDSGCQIVDAVNWMMRGGACRARLWPYRTERFAIQPSQKAYADALNHRVVRAFKVDNTDGNSIRLALTNGYPVIVGSLVYSGINHLDSRNYTLPMPRFGERPAGGHCYVLTGHDDSTRLYRARNSWGKEWGNRGDFLIPYDYIHSGRITEDCWTIVAVTNP